MKGVVFTQFTDLVEDRFGLEMLDRIILESTLPSGGAYTSVATYDHGELLQLVTRLSDATRVPISALVTTFGEHLFRRLVAAFPELLAGYGSVADFLEHLEGTIHQEVLKLYPDAELPQIEFQRLGPDEVALSYRSNRPFADLAEGLIRGCAGHFGEPFELVREDQPGVPGTAARFVYRARREKPASTAAQHLAHSTSSESTSACPTQSC